MTGVAACRGLIAILDKKSKEQLKHQNEQLLYWYTSPNEWNEEFTNLSRVTLEKVFNEIMDYLSTTYLVDVNVGIIPSSTLASQKERPSSEKTPATLSPRL